MSNQLTVHYRLTCAAGETPEEKARGIAFEQTVELPPECVADDVLERVVGRVESLESSDGASVARIVYPLDAVGEELPQLLNLLFGNISMKSGILIEAVEWPKVDFLPGPRFGVEGVRELCGVESRRPLLCAALKPLGLSPEELAEICRTLALAGVDVIKDDHSLADQPWARFDRRVDLCQRAVVEANGESGGSTLYFPNLTGRFDELRSRLDTAQNAGCRGVMMSPMVLGLDVARELIASTDLAVLGHPALTGTFFGAEHGIAPEVLLGELFRLIGCDGVIYPNVGGRFVFDESDCVRINDRLRRPLVDSRPALPTPGGGIDTSRVAEWVSRYGPDTLFLIGTSLYRQPDLGAAAKELVAALREAGDDG